MAGGRPPVTLPENAEALAAGAAFNGSPNPEIAAMLGCAESTLKRRFGPILRKQRALRKVAIRGYQMQAAKKGNPALLIWLGKQELGQRDMIEFAPGDIEKMTDEQLEAVASGKVGTQLRLVAGGRG